MLKNQISVLEKSRTSLIKAVCAFLGEGGMEHFSL